VQVPHRENTQLRNFSSLHLLILIAVVVAGNAVIVLDVEAVFFKDGLEVVRVSAERRKPILVVGVPGPRISCIERVLEIERGTFDANVVRAVEVEGADDVDVTLLCASSKWKISLMSSSR
jgi:hypothetical protein